MAEQTRLWAKGTQRPESYETATPMHPRRATAERKTDGYLKTVVEDKAEGFKVLEELGSGVILIKFDQTPHPDIQQVLADKEFKWAEVKGAWARPISHEGRVAAREVIEAIRADAPVKVPVR